ncbi:MAG TPA: zf-HC2 domain-containing protein, partial [Nakamurella sp.]
MTSGGLGRSELCHDDAAYVLGALSPTDRRTYEEHLRDCPACQASVRSLAGMPGLLALTTEDVVTGEQPALPASLLPGLLRRAEKARRRRGWLVAGLAAATAMLMVAVVWVVARPDGAPTADAGTGAGVSTGVSASPTAASDSDETVPLAQVLPGPMSATLELADKRWGTAITVVCSYDEAMRNSVAYDLAIVDTDG